MFTLGSSPKKTLDPKRARELVEEIFTTKLQEKEEEVELISQRIKEIQHSLQLVRYGAVSAMSNQTQIHVRSRLHIMYIQLFFKRNTITLQNKSFSFQGPQSELYIPSIHPAVNVRGKRPRSSEFPPPKIVKAEPLEPSEIAVPVYVPPIIKTETNPLPEPRSAHLKVKRRIIIGNVSKWIPPDDREDMSTHKWYFIHFAFLDYIFFLRKHFHFSIFLLMFYRMIYVRGDKDFPDVSDVIEKVRFLIHQSYHPNNVIEVSKSPFQLTRRGWGEFPARIQLFFKNFSQNKPVSILHNLKLDKTYTGLQTLGAETCADLWLYQDQEKENKKSTG